MHVLGPFLYVIAYYISGPVCKYMFWVLYVDAYFGFVNSRETRLDFFLEQITPVENFFIFVEVHEAELGHFRGRHFSASACILNNGVFDLRRPSMYICSDGGENT